MGREIRRVPPDWQHPKYGSDERQPGTFKPLLDEAYGPACEKWLADLALWQRGEYPVQKEDWHDYKYFWEYDQPPDKESYREREWTEADATHFQVYETVSEGTPVSPVLPSREAVRDWCIAQGYSASAAENFSREGYAPSLVIGPSGMLNDIESCR